MLKSKKSLSVSMIIVMLLTIVIATVVRVYELLNFVDNRYGVFTQSNVWTISLPIICILGFAAFMALFYILKMDRDQTFYSSACSVACVIFAVCFGYNAVDVFIEYILSSIVTYAVIMKLVLNIGSAVALIALSAKMFGVKVKPVFEYSYFFLILWSLHETITVFISFTSISGVSENTLDMFCCICVMLFAISFVKTVLGYQTSKTKYILFGSAFLSAVICTITMLSRYILFIAYNRRESGALSEPKFIYLAWGVFAVIFLICALRKSSDKLSAGEQTQEIE